MIEHITFTSVFSTTHVSLSIDFTSTLAEVWSQTDQFLDRPLGAPLRRANIRPRYRPSNGSRHSRWPIHNGRRIHKVALRDKCSRGSSHIIQVMLSNVRTDFNYWSDMTSYWLYKRAGREWVLVSEAVGGRSQATGSFYHAHCGDTFKNGKLFFFYDVSSR